MNAPQTRRVFLEKLSLAAAALGLAGALGGRASANASGSSASALVDARIDPSVGQLYLDAHPDESDLEALARAVFDASLAEAGALPVSELQARLAERMRADFAAKRVTSLMGWRLSQTECRFFAMQTLLAPTA